MILDDRKRRILQAIIDDYINSAEPIASRTIAKKHELGLSSATIRNEMADLEELGYLEQPHTSAGRIPSDKGYRIYVDQLMKVKNLTWEEIEDIKHAMEIRIGKMSELIKQASVVLSRITKYTSMSITPNINESALKAVQVVPIEQDKALVIVVTYAGIVRNVMIKLPVRVLPDFMIRISNILNSKLSGFTMSQINIPVIEEIEREIGIPREILKPILQGVEECISLVDDQEIHYEGTTNIFNYREFMDIIKAKEFLNVLEERDILYKLLNNVKSNNTINIQIGSENEIEEMRDCSLITTTYSLGETKLGSLGVIGPTRMEYGRVISSMNYMKDRVNEELSRLMGEDLDWIRFRKKRED